MNFGSLASSKSSTPETSLQFATGSIRLRTQNVRPKKGRLEICRGQFVASLLPVVDEATRSARVGVLFLVFWQRAHLVDKRGATQVSSQVFEVICSSWLAARSLVGGLSGQLAANSAATPTASTLKALYSGCSA